MPDCPLALTSLLLCRGRYKLSPPLPSSPRLGVGQFSLVAKLFCCEAILAPGEEFSLGCQWGPSDVYKIEQIYSWNSYFRLKKKTCQFIHRAGHSKLNVWDKSLGFPERENSHLASRTPQAEFWFWHLSAFWSALESGPAKITKRWTRSFCFTHRHRAEEALEFSKQPRLTWATISPWSSTSSGVLQHAWSVSRPHFEDASSSLSVCPRAFTPHHSIQADTPRIILP